MYTFVIFEIQIAKWLFTNTSIFVWECQTLGVLCENVIYIKINAPYLKSVYSQLIYMEDNFQIPILHDSSRMSFFFTIQTETEFCLTDRYK